MLFSAMDHLFTLKKRGQSLMLKTKIRTCKQSTRVSVMSRMSSIIASLCHYFTLDKDEFKNIFLQILVIKVVQHIPHHLINIIFPGRCLNKDLPRLPHQATLKLWAEYPLQAHSLPKQSMHTTQVKIIFLKYFNNHFSNLYIIFV